MNVGFIWLISAVISLMVAMFTSVNYRGHVAEKIVIFGGGTFLVGAVIIILFYVIGDLWLLHKFLRGALDAGLIKWW